mmetsp:Transcript_5526/g.13440  ORF Transcript_5526/g.13440 Transcript_5526/m.13440 type:complete len:258 (+) Transcript_5526:418-1191(+)
MYTTSTPPLAVVAAAAAPGGGEFELGPRRAEWGVTGDDALQDNLVKEVQWQAHRVAHTEYLDFLVSKEMSKTRESLDEWYNAQAPRLMEKGEQLAMLESLDDVSRWNQEVLAGHRQSQQSRAEISEELAVIRALLDRHVRVSERRKLGAQRRSQHKLHGKGRRIRPYKPATAGGAAARTDAPDVDWVFMVGFATVVAIAGLQTFEAIVARYRGNGPSVLTNFVVWSSLVVAMATHWASLPSWSRQEAAATRRTEAEP